MSNIKIVGDTNHILYPQRYFTPEDEDKMFEDKLNWCYGIDNQGQPILFRFNMNIEKIEYDKETGKAKPKIGENARHQARNQSKTLPSIWNYSDSGEKNFFCAAFEDNGPDFGPQGGVILLSKSFPLTGEELTKAQQDFQELYGEAMPQASVYECGYARVLCQGVPDDLSNKQKLKMKNVVDTPIVGIGRLEMSVKQPSENSLMFKLANINKDFNGNIHKAKNHYNEFRKKIKTFQECKKSLKQDPENVELNNQKAQLLNELNTFSGVEAMRDHNKANRAYALVGEKRSNLEGLLDIYLSSDKKDELLEAQIIQAREEIEAIAIEHGIADFKLRTFHPEGIMSVTMDINELAEKLQYIYDTYTKAGSYGGAYLRVRDNKGRTIPQMKMEYQCKFLGPKKVSNAMDDIKYSMQRDNWKLIQQYKNQGLMFELVPFSITRTPGAGKHGYYQIQRLWSGSQDNGNPAMRGIYQDNVTGEPKNTYVVGIRRRTKNQPDSGFIINVIATGHDGEAPSEHEIDPEGKATIKTRPKKK